MVKLVKVGRVIVVLGKDARLHVVVIDLVRSRHVAVDLAWPAVVAVARKRTLVVARACAKWGRAGSKAWLAASGVRLRGQFGESSTFSPVVACAVVGKCAVDDVVTAQLDDTVLAIVAGSADPAIQAVAAKHAVRSLCAWSQRSSRA